jgi:hypothetical protein
VVRPRLPSIRPTVLITGASASDRGWIRKLPNLHSHCSFRSCSRNTDARSLVVLLEAAHAIPTLAAWWSVA